jgi:hypothetical protein
MKPNANAPAAAASPQGLDTRLILIIGGIGGAIAVGVHQMLYLSGQIFESYAPFLMLLTTYFLFIVVIVFGVAKLKRKRKGFISFMDAMVHVLLACLVASGIHATYDYTFERAIHPNLTVEILENHTRRMDTMIAEQDSILRKTNNYGPEANTASNIRTQILAQKQLVTQKVQELRSLPVSFGDIMMGHLVTYLIFGLFWGTITGIIFRTKSR